MNASLTTIMVHGLKPDRSQVVDGREYFRFNRSQVRRQIGHGHSLEEREARDQARRLLSGRVDVQVDRSRRARLDRPAVLAGQILTGRYKPSAS